MKRLMVDEARINDGLVDHGTTGSADGREWDSLETNSQDDQRREVIPITYSGNGEGHVDRSPQVATAGEPVRRCPRR